VITIYVCNRTIQKNSETYIYSTVSDIPYNKVGLLLGTSPKLKSGKANLYFDYRIKAATELYNAGKVKYILVSGDNRRNSYNEPEEMKKALIAAGIPDQRIILDYAGLRTLDSVVRAHLIFGLERFTLISQQFHNERAIYLAQQSHLQAIVISFGYFYGEIVDTVCLFKIRNLLGIRICNRRVISCHHSISRLSMAWERKWHQWQ
jgi:SanA protein